MFSKFEQFNADHERLREIVRALDLSLFDWDLITRKPVWDNRMYELLDYPKTVEPSFEAWRARVHPDDIAELDAALERNLKKGESWARRYRVVATDGSIRFMTTLATILRDSAGEPFKILGVAWDSSHEIEQENLIRLQQMKLIESAKLASLGEMAGGIAHEINNPLAVIVGKSEQAIRRLREENIPAEIVIRDIEKILSTAARIARIVRGLRNFARDADNDPISESSLSTIIEDSLELCAKRFELNGIRLSVDGLANQRVRCRATQIAQVIVNLLNNSFDAVVGTPSPWVKISVNTNFDGTTIRVTDSGPGIPESLKDKILLPFFTTKPQGKGTGLGLSISKGIIEEHGGTLQIASESENTEFIFSIPDNRRPVHTSNNSPT